MIVGSKIVLRNKILADARHDYNWQTDVELARLDATQPLKISFSQYLVEYVDILKYPPASRRSFAILKNNKEHIGNCAYFNIDNKQGSAEMGLMIGNRSLWNQGYGTDTVTTLVNYIFQKTKLKRLYLKTLETNIHAQRCFKKCGFTPYQHCIRDNFHFVFMELHRKHWCK